MNLESETIAPALSLSQPARRRRGMSWMLHGIASVARYGYRATCLQFVGFLGAISRPGMPPIGRLQAWALRRIGVRCRSNDIWIGRDIMIDFPNALVLGRRVVIGAHSSLTARGSLEIGDDFLSAPGLMINTGSHDLGTLAPTYAPVVIGPGVWCGMRVTIGTGVTIGAGAVIGAGSVVVGDIPAHHVAVGVPCKARRDIANLTSSPDRWSNFRR
jgi:acetyltransferase-like isoleucine patch superfamily enzyme